MIETDVNEPLAPEPRRSRVRPVILSLLAAGAAALAASAGYVVWAMDGAPNGKPVRVIVPEGASASTIATLLDERGVVRSALVFRLVARVRGDALALLPGAYDVRTDLGIAEALRTLRTGVPIKVNRFTIPEGKNLMQIADIVGSRTHISRRDFLRAARSGRHRSPLAPEAPVLEGLLFPDTYVIDEKQSADELVRTLTRQFAAAVERAGLDLEEGRRFGLSAYQVLVVASLIEREASTAKDRPLVASVIYNRLRRGMRLQIDATVQYAIQLQTGKYKGTLLQRSDYTEVRSPYNTYLIDGLPPTPIASPGIESVRAALQPARTSYLYYRLCDENRPSDGHVFAETLQRVNSLCG